MSTYIAPMPMNISSGSTLAIARNTPVRAAARTPSTLTATRNSSDPTTIATRTMPLAAPGQKCVTASARPLLNAAALATRVSSSIQPTSKPTSGPNASRAYR